jgi:N-methylhydantoinase B/oxoprolinase/acetone carboxylase alpha subunit
MTAESMAKRRPLKDQVAINDRLLEQTGNLFGLEWLRRKEEDPGTYEAVWHILLNICNTGWEVGCKVSASAIAAEGGDALWALHLPTGEAICTSKGITAHPGLLSLFVRSLIENDYEENPGFRPGDIFENNDPHYGGIHPVDFDSAVPIFYGDELVAWASAVTHVMDAGYIMPGSIGFLNPDCFSDGVPVTMEKIGQDDRFYPWYEMRMRSRTRVPDFVMGDARGRLAGCVTIRNRVIELIEKYGLDYFRDVVQEYVEDSRRYAVARVKTQGVPGLIRKSNFKDLAMAGKRVILPHQDVDCLFNLPLRIRIDGDAKVHFSLAGASGWVPFGQNITPPAVISALLNAYSHVVGFDMFNWGSVAAWTLETPPAGSWANPYPVNYFASSGVAWAPAVMWMSALYEAFGRVYFIRGYVEEVAAGAATTLTAEFSGINQYGMYTAGLTLEQASNGAPARGMADGENSAWCIYTPNADFGNAEVSELFYPILYLGRNIEPDSGGRKPLVHERGDPTDQDLARNVRAEVLETNLVAPFVTPHQLHEYDLVIHPISGAQALGDPIERDPEMVRADLEQGWTRPWVASDVHGVVARPNGSGWTVDESATARRRDEMRGARKNRGIPFREWWKQEREKVLAKENMSSAVLEMWRTSMELSPEYGAEIRSFWQLPEDFTF